MELRHLRYFVAVARELNFTRAATRLRVAQPALSRQIRQLEQELGVPLLERDKRSVRLTAKGARFLGEAESILSQASQAMERVTTGEDRTISIGYVWGLFHSIVPAALQAFRARSPATAVNLLDMSATAQSDALVCGRLDAGFIGLAFEADRAGLEKHRVAPCSFLVALPKSHRLARRGAVELKALEEEVFLLIAEETFPGASRVMTQACAERGFRPRTLRTAERGHTILSLVAGRCGVALLPASLKALPHEGVVFRPPVKPVESDLFLAWRNGLDRETVDALVKACG